jgi:hypothetical protein
VNVQWRKGAGESVAIALSLTASLVRRRQACFLGGPSVITLAAHSTVPLARCRNRLDPSRKEQNYASNMRCPGGTVAAGAFFPERLRIARTGNGLPVIPTGGWRIWVRNSMQKNQINTVLSPG